MEFLAGSKKRKSTLVVIVIIRVISPYLFLTNSVGSSKVKCCKNRMEEIIIWQSEK